MGQQFIVPNDSMNKTPYHIISQCPGDHHDVLNLMIKSFGGKSLYVKDSSGCTALQYAVHNKNFECLRCLVAHGEHLNLESDMRTLLIDVIRDHSASPSPTCVTRHIRNLLLESVVDRNCTDSLGRNLLCHAVNVGDIRVIHYLLEAGITITTDAKQQDDLLHDMRSSCSKDNTCMRVKPHDTLWNPCMIAISQEMIDVVQLLEKYEQQPFRSIEALKCAVRNNSLKMVNYLLSKYKYSLKVEYPHKYWYSSNKTYQTIITEACNSL